jgi:hypothetical protein
VDDFVSLERFSIIQLVNNKILYIPPRSRSQNDDVPGLKAFIPALSAQHELHAGD